MTPSRLMAFAQGSWFNATVTNLHYALIPLNDALIGTTRSLLICLSYQTVMVNR